VAIPEESAAAVPLAKRIALADELRFVLEDILSKDFDCIADVSLANCIEIIEHHFRDLDRLYVHHQHKKKLVHPSKHIAYLAFWIRKLKPIDSAFKISVLDNARNSGNELSSNDEITDINEHVSIVYAVRLIKSFVKSGHICAPKGCSQDDFVAFIDIAAHQYLNEDEKGGPHLGSRLESLVYDMRYRTFGPHHLVHAVNHIIRDATYVARAKK
jgi:hypothetical protein